MSREPANPLHRGGWNAYDNPPQPKVTQPKPGKRKFRVRVENPGKERREQAFTKLTTTTEALTADELALLSEMREVSPEAAARSLAALRRAKKEKD